MARGPVISWALQRPPGIGTILPTPGPRPRAGGGSAHPSLPPPRALRPTGKLGQASCQSDEFRCDNGKCLPGPWQCNTVDECGDGSDEGNCSAPASEPPGSLCPGGTFPCSGARSTRCLPAERRCDGTQDCGDGSDEAGCPDLACGRRLGNFYGSFASPDLFGAARGPSDLHCTWLVDTQDPRRVLLQLELRLGYDDYVQVYEGLGERGDRLLQTLSYRSNHRPVSLEAAQGRLTVAYHARARSAGHGFNATYQVKGYCLPWEQPCGSSSEADVSDVGEQGCFSEPQRCDGWWHCASGRDEQGCPACPPDQYPCEGGSGLCYTSADRCNNQKSCPDGADEKNCFSCQPGTFHCGTNLCIFETWRCDGQEDCQDGSDEHGCLAAVPRKVITAALIGSLVCGLLLVIALGCAFKLYSLRTQEYRWAGGAQVGGRRCPAAGCLGSQARSPGLFGSLREASGSLLLQLWVCKLGLEPPAQDFSCGDEGPGILECLEGAVGPHGLPKALHRALREAGSVGSWRALPCCPSAHCFQGLRDPDDTPRG